MSVNFAAESCVQQRRLGLAGGLTENILKSWADAAGVSVACLTIGDVHAVASRNGYLNVEQDLGTPLKQGGFPLVSLVRSSLALCSDDAFSQAV